MTCRNHRNSWVRLLAVVLSFLLLFSFSVTAKQADKRPWLFNDLKTKLIEDGFDETLMDRLFSKKKVAFEDKIISSYFMHRESKLNYKQFTKPKTIEKAKTYLKTYEIELDDAETAYGVDKTVIVAILLVETRLGTYVGNNSIFNTLATMASLDSHANRDILWRENLKTLKISRKAYDKKALRKSIWAYDELTAFITYAQKEHIDALNIDGSYAGAMGISQFMPSNALTLAVDGNNDGAVNLFTHADAIASVGNYLKRYGWKPGIDRAQKYKAVYHYNHSSYYVNIVLEISDLLKG